MKHLLTTILLFTFLSCTGQNCNTLPEKFTSYGQAKELVKKAEFGLKESADASDSKWILSITYYSCDKKTGFVIFYIKPGKEYIYQAVPIELWEQWKKSPSKGNFYSKHIKGRYKTVLKQ